MGILPEKQKYLDELEAVKATPIYKEYIDFGKKTGLSENSQKLYAFILCKFLAFTEKKPKSINSNDLKKFFDSESDKKNATKRINRFVVKHFLNWLYKGETPNELLKTIDSLVPRGRNIKKEEELDPDKILTPQEVEAIVKCCGTVRDRAILYGLFDSGCRISEWVNIRLDDIQQLDKYWAVNVDGKTGKRKVFLFRSVGVLKEWLGEHPLIGGKEKNPFVFVPLAKNGGVNKPLDKGAISIMIAKAAKIAGLDHKKINPHSFRHVRATEESLAGTSISVANRLFGWENDSTMFMKYSHIGDKNVEKMLKQRAGLEAKAESKGFVSPTIKCPRCGRENERTAKLCASCSWIFHPDLVSEQEELSSVQSQINELKKLIEDKLLVEKLKDSEGFEEQVRAAIREVLKEEMKNAKNTAFNI